MKFLTFLTISALLSCAFIDPALAGGDGSNVAIGTVADGAAGSSAGGGILIPLILLALVAAAAAGS